MQGLTNRSFPSLDCGLVFQRIRPIDNERERQGRVTPARENPDFGPEMPHAINRKRKRIEDGEIDDELALFKRIRLRVRSPDSSLFVEPDRSRSWSSSSSSSSSDMRTRIFEDDESNSIHVGPLALIVEPDRERRSLRSNRDIRAEIRELEEERRRLKQERKELNKERAKELD
jgi:hypothetical protein